LPRLRRERAAHALAIVGAPAYGSTQAGGPDRSRQHEPLTGPAVRALAAAVLPAEIREAIVRRCARAAPHAATVLAFALAAAGEPLPYAALLELLPDLPSIEYLPALVGAAEGDRVALLLDLVEGVTPAGSAKRWRCISQPSLLGAAPPPPRLVARLRSLARRKLAPEATALIGLAAGALDDPGLKAIAGPYARVGDHATVAAFGEQMRAPLFAHPSTRCRSAKPPNRGGVHRGAPDPEGRPQRPMLVRQRRKYKKCCEGKEPAGGSDRWWSSFEALDERHARVREQLFEQPAAIGPGPHRPGALDSRQLIDGMRRLLLHRRWDLAERFVESIKRRPDVPCGPSTRMNIITRSRGGVGRW